MGTPDAYSDNDWNHDEHAARTEVPERAQRKVDLKELYSSCRNLLMEVEAVIKDRKGNILVKKPIKTFSELFELADEHREHMLPALIEKVKVQERVN